MKKFHVEYLFLWLLLSRISEENVHFKELFECLERLRAPEDKGRRDFKPHDTGALEEIRLDDKRMWSEVSAHILDLSQKALAVEPKKPQPEVPAATVM